MELDGLTMI